MTETTETGVSLAPVIFLAVYWAYLLVWHEWHKQHGRDTLLSSGLPPPVAPSQAMSPACNAAAGAAFNEAQFLGGAMRAYEFILKSYAAGRIDDLAPLLDPPVLEVFAREIERREANGRHLWLTFVALQQAEIVDTAFDELAAIVKVRFGSEIFVSERSNAADMPWQEAARLLQAVDLWTFRREHRSRAATWLLVATDTE